MSLDVNFWCAAIAFTEIVSHLAGTFFVELEFIADDGMGCIQASLYLQVSVLSSRLAKAHGSLLYYGFRFHVFPWYVEFVLQPDLRVVSCEHLGEQWEKRPL